MKRILSIILIIAMFINPCVCFAEESITTESSDNSNEITYGKLPIQFEYYDATLELPVAEINENLYLDINTFCGLSMNFEGSISDRSYIVKNNEGVEYYFVFDSPTVEVQSWGAITYQMYCDTLCIDTITWIPFNYFFALMHIVYEKDNDVLKVFELGPTLMDILNKYAIQNALVNTEFNYNDLGYTDAAWTTVVNASGIADFLDETFSKKGLNLFPALVEELSKRGHPIDKNYGQKLGTVMCLNGENEFEETVKSFDRIEKLFFGEANTFCDKILNPIIKAECEENLAYSKSLETILTSLSESSAGAPNTLQEQLIPLWESYSKKGELYRQLNDFAEKEGEGLKKVFGNDFEYFKYCKYLVSTAMYFVQFSNRNEFAMKALEDYLGGIIDISDFESYEINGERIEKERKSRKLTLSLYDGMNDALISLNDNNFIYAFWNVGEEYIVDLLKDGIMTGIIKYVDASAGCELLFYDLSKLIPFVNNAFSNTEAILSLYYSTKMQADSQKRFSTQVYDSISMNGEVNRENLYVTALKLYTFLKSCYLARDFSQQILKCKINASKKHEEEYQGFIDYLDRAKSEIAKDMAVLSSVTPELGRSKVGLLPDELISSDYEEIKSVIKTQVGIDITLVDSETREGIDGATVVISSESDSYSVEENGNGQYHIICMPGDKTIHVEKHGYEAVDYLLDEDSKAGEIVLSPTLNEKYRRILADLENRYGTCHYVDIHPDYNAGVCYAELMDFDNDGKDEMLVGIGLENYNCKLLLYKERGLDMECYDVSELELNRKLSASESSPYVDHGNGFFTGDGGTMYLILKLRDGKKYICCGFGDGFSNSFYYGFDDNDEFGIRQTISDSITTGPKKYTSSGMAYISTVPIYAVLKGKNNSH